ncbi:hypothetical protein L596_013661 [Steinernema carpocapsae]|uniref:Uncharacterized protein n=1 Tax=Steinernema carpocapsae TaxID=34508 RepID=A0A4U5P1H9_STECR|nr:hypothetical protein L596_013661 [Steinernema carpocapsae]
MNFARFSFDSRLNPDGIPTGSLAALKFRMSRSESLQTHRHPLIPDLPNKNLGGVAHGVAKGCSNSNLALSLSSSLSLSPSLSPTSLKEA